jgi:hypothetical protein
MGGLEGSGLRSGRGGRRAVRRGATAAAFLCSVALLGAAPASAAPTCATFHHGAKAKGLSRSVLAALRVRRVCVTSGALAMEVDVTLSGDVNRTLAKSSNLAVGIVLSKSARARAGGPSPAVVAAAKPIVVATRDLRGRAHGFATRGLEAWAVDRRGSQVTFFLDGDAVSAIRSVDAGVVFKASSAKRAHKADAFADGGLAHLFIQGFLVNAGGLLLPAPTAAQSCARLEELIGQAEVARAKLGTPMPATSDAEDANELDSWLSDARALQAKRCPKPPPPVVTQPPLPSGSPPPPGPIGPEEFGSDLTQDPTTIARAAFDFALWLVSQATGVAQSVTAPADGQVTQVAVRGDYVPGSCPASPDSSCQTILFQDLRPQPDGSVKVISTTQPFTLPTMLGTYTFMPTNFFVKKGDYVALAALGGSFDVLVSAPGAVTDMFQGHNMDMNGSQFTSNNTQNGLLLNTQMTLQPTSSGG